MKITDVFYAAVGAPVLAGRKLKEVGTKSVTALKDGIEASATEGREVADKFGEGTVVEELTNRLDVDERVGKLREQVETVVERWRDGFQADKEPEKKPAAKKAPAKKASATKKAGSAKKAKTEATPKEKAEKKPEAEEKAAAEKIDVTA